MEYLTVRQAAARRGLRPATIYAAIQQGRLPATRILDKIALRVEDVDALITWPANNARKNTSFPGGRGRPKKSLGFLENSAK